MPPEQFDGRATSASDLYSLGATLIFLMAGCHLADLPQKNMHIQFGAKAKHISSPVKQWLHWLINPDCNQRPTSATEALTALKTVLEKGALSPLSELPTDQRRILVDQRDHILELIVRPTGFRITKADFWFDLLVLIFIFSMFSSILGGMFTLFLVGILGLYSFILLRLISDILSVTSGFAGMVLLPTRARNRLLSQLHICLSDDGLIVRRDTLLLLRSRKVLFQAKREDITDLMLETNKNILEIYTSDCSYKLKLKLLGLTLSGSQWLAQEISHNFGINLISN